MFLRPQVKICSGNGHVAACVLFGDQAWRASILSEPGKIWSIREWLLGLMSLAQAWR
jgi:hypothetical protein